MLLEQYMYSIGTADSALENVEARRQIIKKVSRA